MSVEFRRETKFCGIMIQHHSTRDKRGQVGSRFSTAWAERRRGRAAISPIDPWFTAQNPDKLVAFFVSYFNPTTLSIRQAAANFASNDGLYAKAVCRLPLAAASGYLFPKPPLPSVVQVQDSFERPPLPPLIRPLRSIGGLNSAQLNRLFEKVIGHGRFL